MLSSILEIIKIVVVELLICRYEKHPIFNPIAFVRISIRTKDSYHAEEGYRKRNSH